MASAKKPAPEKKQKNIGLVSKSLSFSTLRGVKKQSWETQGPYKMTNKYW